MPLGKVRAVGTWIRGETMLFVERLADLENILGAQAEPFGCVDLNVGKAVRQRRRFALAIDRRFGDRACLGRRGTNDGSSTLAADKTALFIEGIRVSITRPPSGAKGPLRARDCGSDNEVGLGDEI